MKKPDVENCPCCGVNLRIKGCKIVDQSLVGDLMIWNIVKCEVCDFRFKLKNMLDNFEFDPHPDQSMPQPKSDEADDRKYLHCIDGKFCWQKMQLHQPDNIIHTSEEIEMREAAKACEQYEASCRRNKSWWDKWNNASWFNKPCIYTCPPISDLSTKHRIIGERMGWIEKE